MASFLGPFSLMLEINVLSRTTVSVNVVLFIINAARSGKPRMTEAWVVWLVKLIHTRTSPSPLISYELYWLLASATVVAVLILVFFIRAE